jgi:1-acyl-sn-glycerol-3-phosphate acyltransferase
VGTPIRTAYFWIIFVLLTIGYFLFLVVTLPVFLIFKNALPNYVHKLACIWAKQIVVMMPGWRCEIINPERLPRKKAAVMVANHQSSTDILVALTLDRQFRWLSKASVFKLPLIGLAMRLAGYVAIQRGRAASHRKAIEESRAWIEKDVSMFFFPEGTRSPDGRIRPFKVGAFNLSMDMNVPIVPIALDGTKDMMRKGSGIPKPATVKIKILPQAFINPGEEPEDFAERVRQSIIEAVTPPAPN